MPFSEACLASSESLLPFSITTSNFLNGAHQVGAHVMWSNKPRSAHAQEFWVMTNRHLVSCDDSDERVYKANLRFWRCCFTLRTPTLASSLAFNCLFYCASVWRVGPKVDLTWVAYIFPAKNFRSWRPSTLNSKYDVWYVCEWLWFWATELIQRCELLVATTPILSSFIHLQLQYGGRGVKVMWWVCQGSSVGVRFINALVGGLL